MKKGFFLLEALLACALLSLLVGATIHHCAQWSCSYKNSIEHTKALAVLMTLIEQRVSSCPESEIFTITSKQLSIDQPMSAFTAMPTIVLPSPECVEIIVSWNNDMQSIMQVSAIQRGSSEE